MKMGSIKIEAETEEEAIEKAENLVLMPESVNWEDSWNAVDVCKAQQDFIEKTAFKCYDIFVEKMRISSQHFGC